MATVVMPAAMVLSVGAYTASTLPTMDCTTVWISLELETVKSLLSMPAAWMASLAICA